MNLDHIGRPCLSHQWSQGNYVEGGTLEGRVDWDSLDEMEATAHEAILKVYDRYDTVIVGNSGGIDCAVILQMCANLGLDVTAVSILNPSYHACIKEWCNAFPRSLGLDVDIDIDPTRDLEWVQENEDLCIYPTWDDKQELLNTGYRTHFEHYNIDHDVDAYLSGRRNEVNWAHTFYDERWSAMEIRPIYNWTIKHVVAYCDKYDVPICPFYFEFPSTGGYPWYRRRLFSKTGRQIRTRGQWWYWTRRVCLRAGRTDFWKQIADAFPESESLSAEYAASEDILRLDVEDGYEYGLDAVKHPIDVEPAHLDSVREQLQVRDDSHDDKVTF